MSAQPSQLESILLGNKARVLGTAAPVSQRPPWEPRSQRPEWRQEMSTRGPPLPDSLSGIILDSVPPRLRPRRPTAISAGAGALEGAAFWKPVESA